MSGNDAAVAEVLKHLEDFLFALGTMNHLIRDTGQLGGLFRKWEARVDELIKPFQDLAILHLNRR